MNSSSQPIGFSRAVAEFAGYMRTEKGFAPSTVEHATGTLKELWRFLNDEYRQEPRLQDIDLAGLRRYMGYLYDKGNSGSTRGSKVAVIKSFFTFLARRGYLEKNPAERLARPKREKRLPVFLTLDECHRLLEAVAQSPHPELDVGLVKLMLLTGLRVRELTTIRFSTLDLVNRRIHVTGKGPRERLVPLSQAAAETVRAYLSVRPTCDHDLLFIDPRGRPAQPEYVRKVIREALPHAGITKRVTPHTLRHTFATLLYGAGAGLLELQRLLGHSFVTTTEIYTHATPQQLRSAVARHPLKETEEKYDPFGGIDPSETEPPEGDA
ncbi:hypothetical protein SY88_11610 [Clostridiales bacterium PH28_bin88]|nr:hypothetical protein SY88_11610 [Clostridiales bacterium PH28_bin88]